MNAKGFLVMIVCFLALCLVGCRSGEKQAQGPMPPVSQAKQVYPEEQRQVAQWPPQQMVQQQAQQQPMAQKSMAPIFFSTGKSEITPQATSALQNEAEWLKQNPNVKIEISGNTDQRGSEKYNKTLAQKRADAVKQQLVQLGVSADQLQTKSYGENNPVCTEANEKCYSSNRRVDLKAIG